VVVTIFTKTPLLFGLPVLIASDCTLRYVLMVIGP
jgi:hypothetical protein